MQLYQPARNIDYGQVTTTHFTQVYNVPKKVETILKTSCYDCHSNTTRYPWCAYIQPARILIDSILKKERKI
nr:heme-binding domain-containing protein [Flavobacterium sp. K5-23]